MITYTDPVESDDPRVDNMCQMLAKDAASREFLPVDLKTNQWMVLMTLLDANVEAQLAAKNVHEFRAGYWMKFEIMTKIVRSLTGIPGDSIARFESFEQMKEALGGDDYAKDWNERDVSLKLEYQSLFWVFATVVETLASNRPPEDANEFVTAAWDAIRKLGTQVPPLIYAVALERYGVEL